MSESGDTPRRARRASATDRPADRGNRRSRLDTSTEAHAPPMSRAEVEPMDERTTTDTTTLRAEDFVSMPPRALAVCGRPALAAAIRRQFAKLGIECETRTDARRALASLREQPWDLLVVDDAFPTSLRAELVRELHVRDVAGAAIWLTQSASVAETVAAMRIGFEDIVSLPLREDELLGRATELLRKHEHLRRSADRIARWRHVCRRLNQARHEAGRVADEARHDLDAARAETQRQVREAAMASEFRTLVRQELEVEGLLRTSMEYLLSKCGPTNAAVFLDNGEGRWTLGAYVNYRIPRGSISAALERIARQVCPNVAEQTGILRFGDVADFVESVGPEAEPLADQEIVAFACRHDDEPLAVAVLFRDRSEPYAEDTASVFGLIREILAEQMASVVRINHRAKPQWPEEAGEGCDEGDWNEAA